MTEFENKIIDAIAALSRAMVSIHSDGRVWDHDIENIADAIDGINAWLDPNGSGAKIITFPRRPKPEGGTDA